MLLTHKNKLNLQYIVDTKENRLERISTLKSLVSESADSQGSNGAPELSTPAVILMPDALGSFSMHGNFLRAVAPADIYALVADPFHEPTRSLEELSESFAQLIESEDLFYHPLVFVGYGPGGLALKALADRLPRSQNKYVLVDPLLPDALPSSIEDEDYQFYLFARGLDRSFREQAMLAKVQCLEQKLILLHELATLNGIDISSHELNQLFRFFQKNLQLHSNFNPQPNADLQLICSHRAGKRSPHLGWGIVADELNIKRGPNDDPSSVEFAQWLVDSLALGA